MQTGVAKKRPFRKEEDESDVSVAVAAAAAVFESAEAALVNAPNETAETYKTAEVAPHFEAAGGRDEGTLGIWRDDGGRGEVVAEIRQLQSDSGGNTGGNYQVDLVSFDSVLGLTGCVWFELDWVGC